MSGAPESVQTASPSGAAAPPLIGARGLARSFGPTRALRGVDLEVGSGEVVGLIGGNGAGKSTLMNVLGGLVAPDEGSLEIAGEEVDPRAYSPRQAQQLGVRFVHQELSLCSNLRVWENFVLEYPEVLRGRGWRRRARERASEALADVFPDNSVSSRATIDSLSLGQRHMVEIARAVNDPRTRVVILDEPTASLSARRAEQLGAYVKRRAATGTSFIFISHRLPEILDTCSRVVVMRSGAVVLDCHAGEVGAEDLVARMAPAGAVESEAAAGRSPERTSEAPVRLRIGSVPVGGSTSPEAVLRGGSIVGLAGLDGQGQRELLQAVFATAGKSRGGLEVDGTVAFVTGDRAREGVFPLWSVGENITAASLKRVSRLGLISRGGESGVVGRWFDRLKIVSEDEKAPIVRLSGGNQQKALIARALATDADILVLDDPMRGVDPGTKQDLYEILREAAAEGKLILWHSTEEAELAECDEVLVMREGAIVGHLHGAEIAADRVISLSFGDRATDPAPPSRADRARKAMRILPRLVPAIVFIAIFVTLGSVEPETTSSFGLGLTFVVAVPLVLAALSQSFVILGGDVDLGIGYFIGLVNVLAATMLVETPLPAAIALVALTFAYPLMAWISQSRRVPAIVVTLGAGLIWSGLALTKLPAAGGSTPGWLTDAYNISTPILPEPIYICVAAGAIAAFALLGTSRSVALRGLGNNPEALANAGWSVLRVRMSLYLIAGIFALLAGLAVTAGTLGGDANASGELTLLSVAAVILGGGAFAGGVVSVVGAVLAALSLSLIQTLVAVLSVSADYVPLIQGLLLITIVALRYQMRERS